MADEQLDETISPDEASPTTENGPEDEVVFVDDPVFEIDYKGDCAYEVKATIAPANEQKQSNDLFDKLTKEAEVPGFRRGRAPRKLVERKFAKAVRAEAETKLVTAAFDKLVKDNELKPYGPPEIDGLEEAEKRGEGEPLTFTLSFEVYPRVELGKYRGLEIERPIFAVNDDDIDKVTEEMRARHAVYETLKRGKSKEGDHVIIDFKGTVDKEPFEGGSGENYPYVLGTQRFFPEFEKALKGRSAGDKLTCTVTLPEDGPNEDLRGKKAKFAITVKEIKRLAVPDLTDEFAKQAGYDDCTVMREKIAEELRAHADAESRTIASGRALKAIVEDSKIEIPKSLISAVAQDLYEDEVRKLLSARVPHSQIQEREEEMRKQAEGLAVAQLQRMMVLNEIGDAEGIEATEEDLEREAEALSLRTGLTADVVGSYLEQADQRSRAETRIVHNKVLAVVLEHAKIKDVEVSREESEPAEAESEEG